MLKGPQPDSFLAVNFTFESIIIVTVTHCAEASKSKGRSKLLTRCLHELSSNHRLTVMQCPLEFAKLHKCRGSKSIKGASATPFWEAGQSTRLGKYKSFDAWTCSPYRAGQQCWKYGMILVRSFQSYFGASLEHLELSIFQLPRGSSPRPILPKNQNLQGLRFREFNSNMKMIARINRSWNQTSRRIRILNLRPSFSPDENPENLSISRLEFSIHNLKYMYLLLVMRFSLSSGTLFILPTKPQLLPAFKELEIAINLYMKLQLQVRLLNYQLKSINNSNYFLYRV